MADLNKFVEEIESLSVVELNDLVKLIEEKFGVSAAAVAVAVGSIGAAWAVASAAPAEIGAISENIDFTAFLPLSRIQEIFPKTYFFKYSMSLCKAVYQPRCKNRYQQHCRK